MRFTAPAILFGMFSCALAAGQVHPEPEKNPRKATPYYDYGTPNDGSVVVTPQWDEAQRAKQQERQELWTVSQSVQNGADTAARARSVSRLHIKAPPLLEDLRRRAELSQKGAASRADDWGEEAKEYTNWAFSENPYGDRLPPPPPRAPRDDRIFKGDFRKRKEKGVRMFVDPDDLHRALAKSEERALEMVENMGSDLLASGGDSFGVLRSVKRRVAGILSAGKIASRLGYRKMPWSGYREKVIAVSLKNLMSVADRQGDRVDEVRTLARLKRIIGYLLDPENDDLILIGVPGDRRGTPALLLDDLTLTLRSVWTNGLKPGCSLDPDPKDCGGKQKVRIFGVPKESHMSRVMLDADYEMKQINMGLIQFKSDPIPGFVSNFDLHVKRLKEKHTKGKVNTNARFWLTPMRPEPGDIMVEPGRKFVMFQTRVQLLTESMAVSGNALVGTGEVDPVNDLSARIFTAHYEEIETRRVVFGQLHALFDLVMLAQILRQNGVKSELLERVANRQTRPVDVPDAYDGLERKVDIPEVKMTYRVQGGVMVYLKLRRKYARELEKRELARLESAVLDAMTGRHVSIRDSKALERLLRDRVWIEKLKRKADLMFERGTQRFAQGDYRAAERFLTKAVDYDDDFPEAYCQRAMTRIMRKRYKEAIRDCEAAMKRDPELWTSYLLRARARRARGDEDGAKADTARYRKLVEKDEFLRTVLGAGGN